MTLEKIRTAVRETVLEVARRRKVEVTEVAMEDHLHRTLGLASLDLAQILATLELRLGLDPFAELVPITNVRTVADLVSAYELASTGGHDAAPKASLDDPLERARARREAAERSRRPPRSRS